MALASSILMYGNRAGQPAAAAENDGCYYRVTDEGDIVEQSNGSDWVPIGGPVLIDEKTCSGSTATETFSAIPGTYRHLRVMFTGRVTSTGSSNHDIYAQFNGDSGSNYDRQTVFGVGTTVSASQSIGTATPGVFAAPEASVTAGLAGGGEWDIPYYANTSFHKTSTAVSTSKNANSSSGAVVLSVAVHWRDTSAITSILLGVATSGNFASGTKISLYGIR